MPTASALRRPEVISLCSLSLSPSAQILLEFAMAFAVCLSLPPSLSVLLGRRRQSKEKELHSFLSLGRPQKGRGTMEGGKGEEKAGTKLFAHGNLFFQSSTLGCFCSITRAEKYCRGCVKSTRELKVERERDHATTRTTTLHLTERSPAAAGKGAQRDRRPQ